MKFKPNTFKTTFLFAVLLVFFSGVLSYAQNKDFSIINSTQDYPQLGPDKTTNVPLPNQLSSEVLALQQQMKQARLSGDNARVLGIQRQIDNLTGSSVTVSAGPQTGTVTFVGKPVGEVFDNIIETTVFTTPAGTTTKAFTTGIEQRGTNPGRIWTAVAYGSGLTTSPDTIRVFYSDNGGTAWIYYAFIIPGANGKINNDEMDMEIMEYTTGQKYIWLTFGITDNVPNRYADICVLQTPTFAGGLYTLTWPGGSTNTRVYMPRLTSDNANYPTANSWTFLIAARDSTRPGLSNTHSIGEKFLRCTNPFTVTPTFTYMTSAYFYDIAYTNSATYTRTDHCDIAYYRNGATDSLVVSEANLPDSTKIYLARSNETPDINAPGGVITIDGASATYHKQFARVTCNGSNQIMIAYRSNFNNSGDWDIRFARSVLGGVPNTLWTNGYIDGTGSTVNYPFQPDLVGLRGTSSFKCSYTIFSTNLDSAMIVSCPNGTWSSTLVRANLTGLDVSVSASAHAGYRFTNGDSCITAWSVYPATNFWIGAGCSGPQTIGIHNGQTGVPQVYSLSQNYPNPFNPTTNFKFGIPKTGIVKITIYNLTGQEVATVVNELLNAGNYSYDFNALNLASGVYFYKLTANDFTDTKKMMLIK